MSTSTPANTRLYAIGDIHGCAALLAKLLEQIVSHEAQQPPTEVSRLVFLGDYVDRGPDSRGVIELLLHKLPKEFEAIFLKGNHEAMMLDALMDPDSAPFWLMNGGQATLESYGPSKDLHDHTADNIEFGDLQMAIPHDHIAFLENLQPSHTSGDYFFAHAGINPDRSCDDQLERDLLWIRDHFLNSDKDFGKTVVHGHTPTKDITKRENRIGIDTGAVYGGQLTALMLYGAQYTPLHIEAEPNSTWIKFLS